MQLVQCSFNNRYFVSLVVLMKSAGVSLFHFVKLGHISIVLKTLKKIEIIAFITHRWILALDLKLIHFLS